MISWARKRIDNFSVFLRDSNRLLLFISLLLIAPAPFWLIGVGGTCPPVAVLIATIMFFFQMPRPDSWFALLISPIMIGIAIIVLSGLLMFIVYAYLFKFITTLLYRPLEKFVDNKVYRLWAVIALVVFLLITFSVNDVYVMVDMGGGNNHYNLISLLRLALHSGW